MSNKSKTARRLAAWTKTVDEFAGDIESLHCLAIAFDEVLWPALHRPARLRRKGWAPPTPRTHGSASGCRARRSYWQAVAL